MNDWHNAQHCAGLTMVGPQLPLWFALLGKRLPAPYLYVVPVGATWQFFGGTGPVSGGEVSFGRVYVAWAKSFESVPRA